MDNPAFGSFMGREGQTMVRTFLFNGDELSPFSLAAYRTRRAGEISLPVFYRRLRTIQGKEITWDLLIKTWGQPDVKLQLVNSGTVAWHFRIVSSGEKLKANWAPVRIAMFSWRCQRIESAKY
jgi:hypothetical protein